MKKFLTLACALGAVVLASSCQDEDFGADSKQIALKKDFEEQFGQIDPNQDWDFFAQAIQNAKNGGTRAAGDVSVSDFVTYAITDAVVAAANEEFPEGTKYTGTAKTNVSVIAQDTKLTISSVNFGGLWERAPRYGFEFGAIVGNEAVKIFNSSYYSGSTSQVWSTACGPANPKWSKELTVPFGSEVTFYISYLDETKTIKECTACNGTGHNPSNCSVCGGDGIVTVTCKDCQGNGYTTKVSGMNKTYYGCATCGGSGQKLTLDNNRQLPSYGESGRGLGYTSVSNCTKCTECETCHGRGYTGTVVTIKSNTQYCYISSKAMEAGSGLNKFVEVFGFEDQPSATGNNFDCNDFMVCVTSDNKPLIIGNSKRFMCEDLTNSSRSTAWDYNDIVFDVQYSSKKEIVGQTEVNTYTIDVYLDAVGGTLPIYLYITDGTTTKMVGGDELHYVFAKANNDAANADYTKPINVNAAGGKDYTTLPSESYTDLNLTSDEILFSANSYIYAYVYIAGDGNYKSHLNELTDTNLWRKITFTDKGKPAEIIACPSDTYWMKEDTKITVGYNNPKFPAAGWYDNPDFTNDPFYSRN